MEENEEKKAFCNIEQTNNVFSQSATCLLSLEHNICQYYARQSTDS